MAQTLKTRIGKIAPPGDAAQRPPPRPHAGRAPATRSQKRVTRRPGRASALAIDRVLHCPPADRTVGRPRAAWAAETPTDRHAHNCHGTHANCAETVTKAQEFTRAG